MVEAIILSTFIGSIS